MFKSQADEKILKLMSLRAVIEDENRGYYFYVTLIVFLERLNSAFKWNKYLLFIDCVYIFSKPVVGYHVAFEVPYPLFTPEL